MIYEVLPMNESHIAILNILGLILHPTQLLLSLQVPSSNFALICDEGGVGAACHHRIAFVSKWLFDAPYLHIHYRALAFERFSFTLAKILCSYRSV